MLFKRTTALLMVIVLLAGTGFSQTSADAAAAAAKKAKERDEAIVTALDRAIAEIGGLKLPQNRAVVYALSGDLYWRSDADRSRELFRNSAGELLNYNADMEREKLENTGERMLEVYDPNDPRFGVLNLIGVRDPELGIELMHQTRTPGIAEAMAQIQAAAATMTAGTGVGSGSFGIMPAVRNPAANAVAAMDRARAQQELALEQQLTNRAAMSDPEKTVKAIKDSLAKGVSAGVYGLLASLHQKDEKRAAELAGDVVGKINSSDLAASANDLNGTLSILQIMSRPPMQLPPNVKTKPFAFSSEQGRDVAIKVANTMLQTSTPPHVSSAITRALPSIEKLAPEKAILLKQRDAQNKKTAVANAPKPPAGAMQPKWNPNDTPEAIIAAAGKLTNPRDKSMALQSAAGKITQIADEARAKKIIDSIPDEGIRSQARDRYEANRINRMTAEGKLEEAKASIATLSTRRMQLQRLVQLAMTHQRKRTEKDSEVAAELMTEARALTSHFPEDEDELADYMEIVRGYAIVEPDTAFRMIEPLMDQFNDLVQAGAVLSRFNKRDRSFKKGEMVMTVNGAPGLMPFRYVQQYQALARADLDRMNTLADRFQRSDARTLLKLLIIQGYQRSNGPF